MNIFFVSTIQVGGGDEREDKAKEMKMFTHLGEALPAN